MGDAGGRVKQSKYHPNECEHPYKRAATREYSLVTDKGEEIATYDFVICTRCGKIHEQPDIFDFWYVGKLNKKYEGGW